MAHERGNVTIATFSKLAPRSRINSAPKTFLSCPIDAADFANFLRDIFSSNHPDYDELPQHLLATIPKFSLDDLKNDLQKIANLRCADENGIVIEIIKHGSNQLKWHILCCFNRYLAVGEFDADWHQTDFTMLPKTSDLKQVWNWRPIAISSILYILFALMVYHRISQIIFAKQSRDHFKFTPGI